MNDTSTKTWKILALIFIIISAVLFFSLITISPERDETADERRDFPLISALRFEMNQKDVIVNLQPLRDYLREAVYKKNQYKISVYFEYFNTGANISINPDSRILPASLAKLPLSMVVMKEVERRAIRPTDLITLQESQRDRGSGELYKQEAGTEFSVEFLLKELLHHSDNTAYHMLADRVGKEKFSEIILDTGLEELFDDEGRVSAKEYGRVLRSLYNASFLDIEHSSDILNLLATTGFDEFLGSEIPENVVFAHKWGENRFKHIFLDAGIVYIPNRPYMIVVMIEGDGSINERKEAAEIMKDISSHVYQYISQYQR